jgi:hypothetical protein
MHTLGHTWRPGRQMNLFSLQAELGGFFKPVGE